MQGRRVRSITIRSGEINTRYYVNFGTSIYIIQEKILIYFFTKDFELPYNLLIVIN